MNFYIGLENDHPSPGIKIILELTWSKNLPSPGGMDSSSLNSYIQKSMNIAVILLGSTVNWNYFWIFCFLAVWVGLLHNPLFENDGNLCKKPWLLTFTFTCSTRKNSLGPKDLSAPVISSRVVWFWSNLAVVCQVLI